jgi:hypothetical protein
LGFATSGTELFIRTGLRTTVPALPSSELAFVSKPKFTILVCFEGRWFGEILTWFGGKFWFIFGLFEGLLV